MEAIGAIYKIFTVYRGISSWFAVIEGTVDVWLRSINVRQFSSPCSKRSLLRATVYTLAYNLSIMERNHDVQFDVQVPAFSTTSRSHNNSVYDFCLFGIRLRTILGC